jgi:hypothetical protein
MLDLMLAWRADEVQAGLCGGGQLKTFPDTTDRTCLRICSKSSRSSSSSNIWSPTALLTGTGGGDMRPSLICIHSGSALASMSSPSGGPGGPATFTASAGASGAAGGKAASAEPCTARSLAAALLRLYTPSKTHSALRCAILRAGVHASHCIMWLP